MEKTRIGISVGLFGAALYFMGLVSVIPLVLMAGYVLLFEPNVWLKKTAVKAVAVIVFFSILSALAGLVSNTTSFVYDLVGLFRGSVDMMEINRIVSLCRTAISFLQTIFLLMLGVKALGQGSIRFGVVDGAIEKHM